VIFSSTYQLSAEMRGGGKKGEKERWMEYVTKGRREERRNGEQVPLIFNFSVVLEKGGGKKGRKGKKKGGKKKRVRLGTIAKEGIAKFRFHTSRRYIGEEGGGGKKGRNEGYLGGGH